MVERVPLARLKPAEWNPRLIKADRFKNLCASLQADPDLMDRRPILAMADGTIYAGNMRFRAAEHLGWGAVPAVVEDVSLLIAKQRALRDNNGWGEWQDQNLTELLTELQLSDLDIQTLGFDEAALNGFLGEPDFEPVGEDEQGRLDQKAPVTCPNCGHEFIS